MFHLVAVVVFLVSEPLIKKFLSGSCWRKKTIPLVSQNRSRDQEIRSNQQLSASCGFIKSGKIALIVAHRVKLSHQNVFWGNYLKHSPCRLVEPDVCCVARASLQKGKRPSLQVCLCESPTTKRPSTLLPCWFWCICRDSGVVVLLRLTSLSEEHDDKTKSFRQPLCSIFSVQLCPITLSASPQMLQQLCWVLQLC